MQFVGQVLVQLDVRNINGRKWLSSAPSSGVHLPHKWWVKRLGSKVAKHPLLNGWRVIDIAIENILRIITLIPPHSPSPHFQGQPELSPAGQYLSANIDIQRVSTGRQSQMGRSRYGQYRICEIQTGTGTE
jgi:hypothetical protein